jgi:NADH-quinone oxidoreductase subunit A
VPLGGVIFLFVFISLFGVLLLFIANRVGSRIKDPTAVKLAPYECGIPGVEKRDTKISVKFYLTAILFILFDIEIIFMYPWALTFKEFSANSLGWYSLGAMGIFLAVFIFGLFWEVKSRALEWE